MAEYIEREKTINYLMEIIDRPNHPEWLWTDEICGSLNTIPAADVAPVRHGMWHKNMKVTIEPTYTAYTPLWSCSCCGVEYDPAFCQMINYCPNCGARMDGGEP